MKLELILTEITFGLTILILTIYGIFFVIHRNETIIKQRNLVIEFIYWFGMVTQANRLRLYIYFLMGEGDYIPCPYSVWYGGFQVRQFIILLSELSSHA